MSTPHPRPHVFNLSPYQCSCRKLKSGKARLGPSAQLREWFVLKPECTKTELSFFRKGSDLIKTNSYGKENSLSRREYAGEYMHASESQ